MMRLETILVGLSLWICSPLSAQEAPAPATETAPTEVEGEAVRPPPARTGRAGAPRAEAETGASEAFLCKQCEPKFARIVAETSKAPKDGEAADPSAAIGTRVKAELCAPCQDKVRKVMASKPGPGKPGKAIGKGRGPMGRKSFGKGRGGGRGKSFGRKGKGGKGRKPGGKGRRGGRKGGRKGGRGRR